MSAPLTQTFASAMGPKQAAKLADLAGTPSRSLSSVPASYFAKFFEQVRTGAAAGAHQIIMRGDDLARTSPRSGGPAFLESAAPIGSRPNARGFTLGTLQGRPLNVGQPREGASLLVSLDSLAPTGSRPNARGFTLGKLQDS